MGLTVNYKLNADYVSPLAAAEALDADVFLSCDDRLVKRARRRRDRLEVQVANPLDSLKEVGHDDDT